VRSVVGRFLEHSRILWFQNGGHEELYLSSADLMERNLDRRVETAFPIEGKKLQQRIHNALLRYLDDNTNASLLQPDGEYLRLAPAAGEPIRNVQAELMEKLCGAGASGAH
jgi:polyphosphate kinase